LCDATPLRREASFYPPPPVTHKEITVQTGNVVSLYEMGLRGRPIETIGEGDLAEPGARTLTERVRGFFVTMAEVARESRELEIKMLGDDGFRRLGEH
jgi:hypothetical protein